MAAAVYIVTVCALLATLAVAVFIREPVAAGAAFLSLLAFRRAAR